MKVGLTLKDTSKTLWFDEVSNTYEKGSFYCIYINEKVNKFPINDIFSIIEDYGSKTTLSDPIESDPTTSIDIGAKNYAKD